MTVDPWTEAMRRGDFAAAHAIGDAVLAGRDQAERDDPKRPYHLRWVWNGDDLVGKHVLVRCYHGLGDTIQFARFLPHLRRRAASVTVEVQRELLPLLATMGCTDKLVPFQRDRPLPPSAHDVEIMELAHALRLDAASVPVPYVSVPAIEPGRSEKLQVGLCWQGSDWDHLRAIPPASLQRTCNAQGVTLWSLQRSEGQRDVMAIAASVAGLDLVVTVDTMIAHLAGALGKETWLLLRHRCDWRWMDQRADSPWYPSMRLYRQDTDGDWSTPLARIANDLRLRTAVAAG